ncbi:hypothetical protein BDW22DRAFT_1358748 [Trametopsis cervina]|nr:hypothetical protein BDW22DRAFT_1358748 [Trametopsis cervina]
MSQCCILAKTRVFLCLIQTRRSIEPDPGDLEDTMPKLRHGPELAFHRLCSSHEIRFPLLRHLIFGLHQAHVSGLVLACLGMTDRSDLFRALPIYISLRRLAGPGRLLC